MEERLKKSGTQGRPRSETARRALLDATTRLIKAGPIREMTITGIAREAGVGKPTIYRWWDGKCSLVMDAFFDSMATGTTFPRREKTTDAIAQHVLAVVAMLRGPAGPVVAEMIGEGQSQPEILEKFRNRFFEQLLAPVRMALELGKASGEFDTRLDEALLLDLIYGPIFYRLLLAHLPLDERFARDLSAHATSILRRHSVPAD